MANKPTRDAVRVAVMAAEGSCILGQDYSMEKFNWAAIGHEFAEVLKGAEFGGSKADLQEPRAQIPRAKT